MEGTPVTFKSLNNKTTGYPVGTLPMTHFLIEYYNTDRGYYILKNEKNPAHPLKMFPKAMNTLRANLQFAMDEAAALKERGEFQDNEVYEVCVLNSHGTFTTRLVLSTFQEDVYLWARLYVVNDNGDTLPTQNAVRFDWRQDNADALKEFIVNMNYLK